MRLDHLRVGRASEWVDHDDVMNASHRTPTESVRYRSASYRTFGQGYDKARRSFYDLKLSDVPTYFKSPLVKLNKSVNFLSLSPSWYPLTAKQSARYIQRDPGFKGERVSLSDSPYGPEHPHSGCDQTVRFDGRRGKQQHRVRGFV